MIIILYIIILLISFILLARIVDCFFVKSLDKISKNLNLSSDAAGATLMAIGSSAPELFIALFAILKSGNHNAIGIGSIVGSALFNLLAICGIVAFAKKSILVWQPIIRDIIFYFISVVLFVWGITDGKFSIIDALIFIGIYIVYVITVINWQKIFPHRDDTHYEIFDDENTKLSLIDRALTFIFPKPEHYYLVFSLSIILIAALSWILVESAIKIAYISGIPEGIIALTILAAGTSIPDLISSLIVAKQGRGNMAISNAIGSNIFDILIGLGLPFFIYIFVFENEVLAPGNDLEQSSFVLLASLIIFTIVLFVNKFIIGKKSGIIFLSIYILYLAYEIGILYFPNLFN